jgi:hypothetical protein
VGAQRKKKGSRVTPKGGALSGRFTPAERAGLDDIFERILRSAPKDLSGDIPALAVEMWASQMWSIWANSELIGMDAVETFAGGLIKYSAKRATPSALMVLRALGAVAPAPYGLRSRREADRLAASGIAEPGWVALVGVGDPTAAWLSYDPIDDDGVSVMVGFDGPGEPSTVGVYIDHNLGGMAKDGFAVPAPVEDVVSTLRAHIDGLGEPAYRQIPLREAAARWREALEMTDMMVDPPASEDLEHLRAIVMARLMKLPSGGKVPSPEGLDEDERDRLLEQFFESEETVGLRGLAGEDSEDSEDGAVEHLSHQILTFSLDYVLGTPLRFSPVMVEMFCLDWAPRKIAIDGDGFTLLPDVLEAWIRFAGRTRGISEDSIKTAVEAAYELAPEMIELSQETETWGPAKTMVLAMQQRGIDVTDQAALDDFVAEVNRNGGIDVLAESLVGSARPQR